MNPKESPEVTIETLLALRRESDALGLITEKLRVKDMGPADHIRTKHEVKKFLETADASLGTALIKAAAQRLSTGMSLSERRGLQESRSIES